MQLYVQVIMAAKSSEPNGDKSGERQQRINFHIGPPSEDTDENSLMETERPLSIEDRRRRFMRQVFCFLRQLCLSIFIQLPHGWKLSAFLLRT